jgi:hypothetical protein
VFGEMEAKGVSEIMFAEICMVFSVFKLIFINKYIETQQRNLIEYIHPNCVETK